jgi:hypothetical protein
MLISGVLAFLGLSLMVVLFSSRQRQRRRTYDRRRDRVVQRPASAVVVREPVAGVVTAPAPSQVSVPREDPWPPDVSSHRPAGALGLEALFIGSLGKEVDSVNQNEDAWILDSHGTAAAVFDGATESFAPRRWARQLASSWATGKPDWFATAQDAYEEATPSGSLSWAQEAAAIRGSFATIAAVEVRDTWLEVTCVGDSCALRVQGSHVVDAYPLSAAADFTSAPAALPSERLYADQATALLNAGTTTWAVTPGTDEIWLVTDAIAAWLLTEDPAERFDRLTMLASVTTQDEFRTLILTQRASQAMRVDDCTWLRLSIRGIS